MCLAFGCFPGLRLGHEPSTWPGLHVIIMNKCFEIMEIADSL